MAYYTAKDFPGIDWQNTQGYNPIQMPSWEARVLEDGLLGDEEDDTTTGVVTDSSGEEWVMGPDGQYYSVNSDYGQALLGEVRMGHPGMYDSSGAFVGAESQGERLNVRWGGGPFSKPEWESSDLDPIDVQKAALDDWNIDQGYTGTADEVFIDDAGNRYREVTNPYTGRKERISMGGRKAGLNVSTAFVNYMKKGGPFAVIKTLANMLSAKPTKKKTATKQTTTPSLQQYAGTVPDETPLLDAYRAAPNTTDYASAMRPGMPGYEPEEMWDEPMMTRAKGYDYPSYSQGLLGGDIDQVVSSLLSDYAIENTIQNATGGYVPDNYVEQHWANDPQEAIGWARKNAFDAAQLEQHASEFSWAGASPVVQENTGAIDDDEDDEAYAGMLEVEP